VAVSESIDRLSPTPYYEQLFDILRRRVVSGELPADSRLPGELELSREYGLSRATVRQTLTKLEQERFARRIAHRGFFAAMPEQQSGWTVHEGFLESQIRHGRTGIDTVVVDAGFVAPPTHVAEALHVAADGQVFALQRVRSLDGRAAMFSTNWFPTDVGTIIAAADDVLSGVGSVNSTLRDAGLIAHGAHRVIRALGAPATVATHLQVSAGEPILRVRSLSWRQDGKYFDYYETWVLTDIIPLEVEVTAN
jgi:GntR family transcriptional regulator